MTVHKNAKPAKLRRTGRQQAVLAAVNRALSREHVKMGRRLSLLELIAGVSILLGLFGTVTGILHGFHSLNSGSMQPNPLSGAVQQALFSTWLGLAVAIPCKILHSLLKGRSDMALWQVRLTVLRLLAPITDPRRASTPKTALGLEA